MQVHCDLTMLDMLEEGQMCKKDVELRIVGDKIKRSHRILDIYEL